MNYALTNRSKPPVSFRIGAWLIAIVAWASWCVFVGGASTAFLIVGVSGAAIVEAAFWVATLRRAFSPWKPAGPNIRFAKGR